MKICIIGAGITGLTIGKLLSDSYDITILEKDSAIGGIARTKDINGIAYHMVGGHCLNSKNDQVMDFIFNKILSKNNWHKVKRNAKIYFKGHFISYPIEFAVREIAKSDEDLAFKITKDFLSSKKKNVENLADWFKVNFGRTLATEYFIPYNRKIWRIEPSKMSYLWVKEKLPLPNKKEFFRSLLLETEDKMPHNVFYYPNTNTQNSFIEALGNGLNIITKYKVESIERINSKWCINGEFLYDIIISTMPLNLIPYIIKDTPIKIKKEANKLKYNKITNVLWKNEKVDFTWSYYPSPDTIFHRHIHIGNFFIPKQNYTITESMGEHSYEEMINYGKKFDYLLQPIDYNVSDYAYVVYDKNYKTSTKIIKDYLYKIGIISIGRFGEWEYYNMDKCIESAMRLAKDILRKYE